MNHPYDDFNNKNPNDDSRGEGNSYEWKAPFDPNSQKTYWQGDYYHSGKGPAQDGTPPVPALQAPRKRKGKKTALKVAAGLMACLMISAGSIGGFVALVNNGYVTLNNGGSEAAFTINKVAAAPAKTSSGTATALTTQQIAKKVIPSVVCIQNYQINNTAQALWQQQGGLGGSKNGNGENGSEEEDSSGVSPTSEGSGIIMTSDGYIVTNAHVVSGATSLKVILSDGKSYQAKLIGSDSVTDLALIKISATGLTPAEFGSSSDLQVADTVMAIGNPGGLEFNSSVTIGYISALNREITNSENGYTMKCIQTDAAINPGNSGGPLVNSYGQVIGINSSKIVASGYEGLGFAIPIDVAQPIISDLKQYGYVKDRAVLGISYQYLDSMTSRFYGLPTGVYVVSISSPAVSEAGIEKGDVITEVDGKTVNSSTVVTSIVASKKPGQTVSLKVTRPSTGKTFTATVKLSQSTGK